MVQPTMVAAAGTTSSGHPSSAAAVDIHISTRQPRFLTGSWPRQLGFDRMPNIWFAGRDQGISREAFSLLHSAVRESTTATYNRHWREFVSYVGSLEVVPPTMGMCVANFLAHLYDSGRFSSVSSIRQYRAALVMAVQSITGSSPSDNMWVQAVMQAIERLLPERPRYSAAWDVDLLFGYWASQPPSSLLSLKLLQDKAMSLLMATGVMRSSDLRAMLPSSVTFSPDSLSFKLLNPKNAKGETAPILLARNTTHPNACAVEAFQTYWSATQQWRTSAVWVSVFGKHLPLSARTIASRVLAILESAGVDISKFKTHSIRMAAASKALDKGATLDEVLQHARWRSAAVFQRYYERTRAKPKVSKLIMS